MSRSSAAVIASALIFAICYYEAAAVPRIIDGIRAHIQDFPFVALISPRPCSYVVYFYVQNRCQPSVFPPHDILRLHGRSDSVVGAKVQHDIMVLELVQPRTVPIYAQLPSDQLTVSQIGTVVGFGLVKILGAGNPRDLPCSLQQMNEFVLPLSRCDFIPGRIVGAFCAFNPLRHFATACRGDSGGPWFTRDENGNFVLYGVSSFGDEKCRQDRFHDAFTNVYFYRDWIIAIVNGYIE